MTPPFSVVIPALNEEPAIGAVIDRLKTLSPVPEIIVINDGSTDKTGDVARQKGAIVISHPIPGGYGRSMKDGIRLAKNDIIVMTDADGTYPIEDIPKLITHFERGFDMVVGARRGKHYRGSFFKMPARILLKWLVEFTTGRLIPDINSGFRVVRKSDVLAYEHDLCNGFSFTTTITLVYMLSGKFVDYMSIDYFARVGHSKVHILRDSLRTLQYITEVILLYNPLKLFVLFGLIVGIPSAILCLGELRPETEWLLFPGVIGIAVSLIIFALGLVATALRSAPPSRPS